MSGGGGHGGGGDERWLISYADFITLLMVFFVIMYSIAQVDVAKYQLVAESLRRAFGGGEAASPVDPAINESGFGDGVTAPSPITVRDFPPRPPDSLDVATNIGAALTSAGLSGEVSVNNNAEGVLISISEQLLFQPGSADIQPQAQAVLNQLAGMLKTIPNDVRVVAHTDPAPPTDPRYPTNWDLSTARAVSIVRYLVEFGGIDAPRLTAAGQAEYHPVFPNDSAEHMQFNRRADIVIVYPLEHTSVAVGIVPPIHIPGVPALP